MRARKAVTAEAQMMNTNEYRVDCQLLQYLHWENALGCRFPIGKMDQVQKWERDEIMSFWKKHYFPGNATLYVVGDVDVTCPQPACVARLATRPEGTMMDDWNRSVCPSPANNSDNRDSISPLLA